MIKIDMAMPENCKQCPFYRGSHSGGSCAADEWDELFFGNTYIDIERHSYCPLQEVE